MSLPLQDAWNERNNLFAKVSELFAEACNLRVEATKLRREAASIWANAIIEKYGNISVCYIDGSCFLENGDVYCKPEKK